MTLRIEADPYWLEGGDRSEPRLLASVGAPPERALADALLDIQTSGGIYVEQAGSSYPERLSENAVQFALGDLAAGSTVQLSLRVVFAPRDEGGTAYLLFMLHERASSAIVDTADATLTYSANEPISVQLAR